MVPVAAAYFFLFVGYASLIEAAADQKDDCGEKYF